MAAWHAMDPAGLALGSDGLPESSHANAAAREYLRAGSNRSLEGLLTRYCSAARAPTRSLRTLRRWAVTYDWAGRAAAWDDIQRQVAEASEEERHRQSLQSGLALAAERVDNLKLLYADLFSYYQQVMAAWREDLQPGSLEPARPAVPRFNTGIFIQLRGLLDDLASETGGRVAPALPGTSPVGQEETAPDYSLLSREEMRALVDLLQKATPGQANEPDQLLPQHQPSLPGFDA
jgi:hypothetical protein